MVQADYADAPATGSRLSRLLAPRSIAFIGGAIAEMAIARCLEAGFDGEIAPPACHYAAGSVDSAVAMRR